MATIKQAYGYLRISGKGQIAGSGLQRQRETIAAYAAKAGVEVVDYFEDVFSGTEATRPAFTAMLEVMLSNSVRTIIVESLDRFARSLGVQIALLAKLEEHKLTLISASTGQNVTEDVRDDPMRGAMVSVQGVFYELEKRVLVRKLANARRDKRAEFGRCEGAKPFGFYPGERETLDRMLALRRRRQEAKAFSGKTRPWPFKKIADTLNAEGRPTRHGRRWHATSVIRIMRQERARRRHKSKT